MALVGAQFVNAVSPNPVGSLQAYAGASAPTGWLLCDGTLYSTSVYPELFSVLGYTYGGSGASFNVPDLRGRAPIGAGTGAQNGGTGTGAISGGTALTARTRGAFGGDERLQSHKHYAPGQRLSTLYTAGGSPLQGWNSPGIDALSDLTSDHNQSVGSGGNMPPFVVTNYIIKAIPDAPRSGLAYGSTPPIVTALPSNPQFGDVVTYIADATNGVAWNLQYDATGTYPWKFIGGAALYASAGGTYSSPATGSTSTYVNSGLSGSPSITIPLPGDYYSSVTANGKTSNASPAPGVFISYNGSAPGSWDGADSLAGGGAATSYVLSAQKAGTLTAASQTVSLVWLNANIGGTASFYNIRVSTTPIRVKAA